MPRRIFTILASILFAIGIALVIWAHHGGSPTPNAATGQVVEIAQGHFTAALYVTPLRADLNIAGIVALLVGVALAAFPASARRRRRK
jgi:drug/metabolite transporter (DMT)-like permease